MNSTPGAHHTLSVVPTGELLKLRPADVKPNPANPRMLFDPEPLADLKANIRLHGVLVPITVYPLPGSDKFGILDGARRHRCCVDLEAEGHALQLPANVVQPPDPMAGLLYMFSIHNFREQWELMPTALSLRLVIDELGESDTRKLCHLTGLSEPQVERCKLLLQVPARFQEMSLDPNPRTRIPSNFWIEAHPVLEIIRRELPRLSGEFGGDGVLARLVEKYRAKKIKSVIHFRRIVEAYENSYGDEVMRPVVLNKIEEYLRDVSLETRRAFDDFVVDNRRVQSVLRACESFVSQLSRARIEHAIDQDRDELMSEMRRVRAVIEGILTQLEGTDPPSGPASDDESVVEGP